MVTTHHTFSSSSSLHSLDRLLENSSLVVFISINITVFENLARTLNDKRDQSFFFFLSKVELISTGLKFPQSKHIFSNPFNNNPLDNLL